MSFRALAQVLVVAIWVLSLAALYGLLQLEDLIEMSLYQYFGSAAVLGWLFGNAYSYRLRRASPDSVRSSIWGYVLAPPGLIYLLHAANQSTVQHQVPLAPVYGLVVFLVIFLVPATLGRTKSPRN